MKRSAVAIAGIVLGAVLACDLLIVKLGESSAEPRPKGPARIEVDIKAPSRVPVLKAEAQEPTVEGATAFVRHWFDALNFSLAHATDEPLISITGAGCQQCSGWILGIHKWKGAGLTLGGGLAVPVSLAVGPFSTREPVQFAATYLISPATLTDRQGKAQSYPGGRTRGGLTVLWANGRWQMTDIVLDVKQATR